MTKVIESVWALFPLGKCLRLAGRACVEEKKGNMQIDETERAVGTFSLHEGVRFCWHVMTWLIVGLLLCILCWCSGTPRSGRKLEICILPRIKNENPHNFHSKWINSFLQTFLCSRMISEIWFSEWLIGWFWGWLRIVKDGKWWLIKDCLRLVQGASYLLLRPKK